MTGTDPAALKAQAAERAVSAIENDMVVGLGTGSTATLAVDAIGRRVREEGLRVTGIPTSERTAAQARELGIPLSDFAHYQAIDVTLDGADAVERGSLALIKGLGGALLREKIVASASRRMIVMVDQSKLRGPIGSFCPVPVEVTQFGWQVTQRKLADHARGATLRPNADGTPFVTDGGNYIVDCDFGAIAQASTLEPILKNLVGVVETGLFIRMASTVIIAGSDGIEVLEAHV